MRTSFLSLASWFTIEARDFENIRFDAAARGTLRDVILAVCFGIILATLYGAYQRRVAGALPRALLAKEALSKESALTLEELGLDLNPFVMWELKKNASLRRLLRAADTELTNKENGPNTPEKSPENSSCDDHGEVAMAKDATNTDNTAENERNGTNVPEEALTAGKELPRTADELLACRLYIPEALKYRAEIRFSKEGTGLVGLAVTVGLTVVLAVLLIRLMPAILGVVDTFM